ncbi:MAP kinase kinase PBS2 [Gossypium arboreum]|uniref:MAP kinase kinase PBS2 n=1 Tax=Gossypium arboreum TaxID=29729 RepID=A0A0B0M995_GOSAR|nr:MAP kinase kinase PBS2 [Gossypium arboreum]
MRGERERSRLQSPSSRAPAVGLTRPRVVADSSPTVVGGPKSQFSTRFRRCLREIWW